MIATVRLIYKVNIKEDDTDDEIIDKVFNQEGQLLDAEVINYTRIDNDDFSTDDF